MRCTQADVVETALKIFLDSTVCAVMVDKKIWSYTDLKTLKFRSIILLIYLYENLEEFLFQVM